MWKAELLAIVGSIVIVTTWIIYMECRKSKH